MVLQSYDGSNTGSTLYREGLAVPVSPGLIIVEEGAIDLSIVGLSGSVFICASGIS